MVMPMLSLTCDSSTSAVVHRALMVMPPASLSAAGPLALSLFAPAAVVIFGAAVMDVVPAFFTGFSIIICLFPGSGSVPVSVAVVAAGLGRWRRRVGSSLSLIWHAGLVMVVLVAAQQRPIPGLNNQWTVKVGLHVRPDVEGCGQAQTFLGLQLTVQGLAACTVLPPQLVGPLLPHRHCLQGLLLLLTSGEAEEPDKLKPRDTDITIYSKILRKAWFTLRCDTYFILYTSRHINPAVYFILHLMIAHMCPYMLNDLQYDQGAIELSTQQTTGSIYQNCLLWRELVREYA